MTQPPIHDTAHIIQLADENKTLPDGSRVMYAENDAKIVLFHKPKNESGITYVYNRKTCQITVNGKEGTNQDKRTMIRLGSELLAQGDDVEMVTVSLQPEQEGRTHGI